MADGNRRWYRENGFTDVSHGHRVGAQKIAELCSWCDELGIPNVTVYLLSTENLKRSEEELSLLCNIIGDVSEELAKHECDFRLRCVGQLDLLPEPLRTRLEDNQKLTEKHSGVRVNIAVGYGVGRKLLTPCRNWFASWLGAG